MYNFMYYNNIIQKIFNTNYFIRKIRQKKIIGVLERI